MNIGIIIGQHLGSSTAPELRRCNVHNLGPITEPAAAASPRLKKGPPDVLTS
jgi:hypothetical protein